MDETTPLRQGGAKTWTGSELRDNQDTCHHRPRRPPLPERCCGRFLANGRGVSVCLVDAVTQESALLYIRLVCSVRAQINTRLILQDAACSWRPVWRAAGIRSV